MEDYDDNPREELTFGVARCWGRALCSDAPCADTDSYAGTLLHVALQFSSQDPSACYVPIAQAGAINVTLPNAILSGMKETCRTN